jgi:hypothetical protein
MDEEVKAGEVVKPALRGRPAPASPQKPGVAAKPGRDGRAEGRRGRAAARRSLAR